MSADTLDNQERLLKLATWAPLLVAGILIIIKIFAWFASDSVSILASLIDSTLDLLASLINFFAIRYALKPADEDHRFGHGKAESLAALGQSLFIMGSAAFLLIQATDRMLSPEPVTESSLAITVMIIAMVLTAGLIIFQYTVAKKTRSTAIKADATHYMTDLGSNAVTLIAIVLSVYGFYLADPIIAIGIAAFIFYSAYSIASEAINLLMDTELPENETATIKEAITAVDGVQGYHDFRSWQSGRRNIYQVHIEVNGWLSLKEAHDIAEQVIAAIKKEDPDADITIHQDPV